MREVVLAVEHVTKKYGAQPVLQDISFTLAKGETLALVGESGCGKSTLARIIIGIEPSDTGKIVFLNQNQSHQSKKQIWANGKAMQMIFQNPATAISPRMKIGTFMMEPFINYKICSRTTAKSNSIQLLKQVGLSDEYMDKYPHQVSGGQLQRVMIARSLALNPQLLICDEITSALDVSIQQQIMDLITEITKQEQLSMLFISHDLALVKQISQRILVMYLGNVVEIIDSADLVSQALHPYTRLLLESVLTLDTSGKKQITTINESVKGACPFYHRCVNRQSICKNQKPELKMSSDNHFVACHLICGS